MQLWYAESKYHFENDTINTDAMIKEVDEKVKDKEWNALLKDMFKTCAKRVEENSEELEKDWSTWTVPKEECNFKPFSMFTCLFIEALAVNFFLSFLNYFVKVKCISRIVLTDQGPNMKGARKE